MKSVKMIIRFLILILIPLLSFVGATAQKVKYKDLVVLLLAKQYEKAEPFLKKYLKDNNDNPNAFLYMGIIFQEKSSKIDPLIHTEILCANIDSSVIFYDKAFKAITEKELRKNDEYYEAYMRRDLRTGKFVIKLSDVQLDIENRMHGLKERKERVKQLKHYFDESSTAYTKANALFKSLLTIYGSEREFFLRADDDMLANLKRLTMVFDSATNAFDKYKSISKELGKTGYSQLVDLQEIKDMKRDGSSPADFMKDDLRLWDYKRWAIQSINVIEKEINPMRENLVAYDIEINKLREKLKKDSLSVRNDLTRLVDKLLSAQLKKYDPDPMPLAVFAMKIAELEYHSNVILNKRLRDSANVKTKLSAIKSEIDDLTKLDSLATRLSQRNFEEEEKDYRQFIVKVFGATSVLKNTVSATQEFAKRERVKRETEWEAASQSLKWLVSANDSIPLYFETNRDLKFKALVINEEKFTVGLSYQDSLATGYFYTITPSRIPDLKANFAVDPLSFKKRFFSLAKGLATTDGSGNVYILLTYSIRKVNNKFPATIAKVYRSDGLAWSNNFSFEMLPKEIGLNSEGGEITVTLTNAEGAAKIVVIDKNGKIRN
jgi:tetratricopeptide (TPR) repeat protein